MKTIKSILEIQTTIILSLFVFILLLVSGCSENENTAKPLYSNTGTFAAIALDRSQSITGYRKMDTGFIAHACNIVALTGGVVEVYGIGSPSDFSGIRCYLQRLPEMNEKLTLSQRAQLRAGIDSIKVGNDRHIHELLIKVQEQVLNGSYDSATDINGVLGKIEISLNEPQHLNLNRYVFCFSDGIQSLRGRDSPASYQFKSNDQFTLCLAGWKTKPPSNSVKIIQFEDPEGFLEYLKSNSFNH